MNKKMIKSTKLNETAIDVLGEVGNISMSNAATALSMLLNRSVVITTPKVELTTVSKLNETFLIPYVLLQIKFEEGFAGSNALMMGIQDAAIIADILMGGTGATSNTQLSEIELSAISEVMNQMMGSASTALATMFSKRVNISPPSISVIGNDTELNINGIVDEEIVKISFRLKVDDLIDSEIMQIYSLDTSEQIINEMLNPDQGENIDEGLDIDHDTSETCEIIFEDIEEDIIEVKKPKFSQLTEKEKAKGKSNIDMILDIPLELSVILGNSKRSIKEILSLEPGSIIELNEFVEEPLDIYVNGKRIAKGEVVVVDEKFGVRITQILSPKDRVKKLK